MSCEKIFAEIDALAEEYLSVWVDACNIESPTDCKAGVDAVGEYFTNRAAARGWQVDVCRQTVSGDCVCITMNPDAPGAPVSLSGHMDTVHPVGSFGTPAVRVEGDKIYGPGVLDCKGGIVAAFLAMDALCRCGFDKRPVHLLLQSDEENSSINSGKETVRFMAEKSRGCVAFLNCEGAKKGSLTVGRKGIIRYEFSVMGKAAHSSNCYDGVSAICEAALKILELEKWKDREGITCNCGVISGGTVANTVPESCVFQADIRYKTLDQLSEVENKARAVAETSFLEGTTCELRVKSQRLAMEKTEANLALLDKINAIYARNGFPTVAMAERPGGSDAADMTAYGLPTVDSMGVSGKNIHTVNEYAEIPSLTEAAKRLAAIVHDIE
ncbi:MAG: M20/M25/M40 family metallo-hydrolase [Clostridia bacterium]|nr:M20/M25/M40 family metallo-hydrolase [Clostridia bacterium]